MFAKKIMEEAILKAKREVDYQWEQEIRKRLSENGFEFNTEEEFHEFCKTRCVIKKQGNNCCFCVDNQPICTWVDNYEVTDNGSKITISYG